MSAKTVDAPMSENCVLQLSNSSPGCMLGSGTVDVDLSDVVPQGAALDLGPQVNPPQAVSARCANLPRPDVTCDLPLLRSASSDTGLPVNESSNAHVMQPSDGPMGQWSGCNMGLTGFARGDNYNPSCGPPRLGNPELPTAFGRGQKVSTEGPGDMEVDFPMPAHGSSHHPEPAVLPVGLRVGARLDGPVTSYFACAATKVRGGGELPVRSRGWGSDSEDEEQDDQHQAGFGYLQAHHAATRGDQAYKESGPKIVASYTSDYHASTGLAGYRQDGGSAGGKRPGNSQRASDFRMRAPGQRQMTKEQHQISPGDRNSGRGEIRPDHSKPASAGLARQDRIGRGPNSTHGEQSPRFGWSNVRPSYNNKQNNNYKNQKSQDATVNKSPDSFRGRV